MESQYRLPVRLLPRRRAQIPQMIGFTFFLGFSIVWMAGAGGILDLDTGTIRFLPPGGWAANSFALFGLPFAAIGLSGVVTAMLKLLPSSPFYHLEVNADGLLIRSLFKQQRHPWRALPVFETLERRRRTKNATSITWYTVAMESAPPKPGMESGAASPREVLRIDADEYGAKNGEQDAADLATWLNSLRASALDKRLSPNEPVEVPAGFVANAITAPGRYVPARRNPTVVRN